MKKLLIAIPNSITSLNLLMGCFASILLLKEQYLLSVICVIVGLIADFLDGFVARILKVQSELGKQLDSLADLVTFGFYPGVIAFSALSQLIPNSSSVLFNLIPYIGFLVTLSSGIRLAVFNLSANQSTEFIGLPTPANTMIWLTWPLMMWYSNYSGTNMIPDWLNWSCILGLVFISSYILNSKITLISLKFKGFDWSGNWEKYLLLISSLVLILIFGLFSTPFIITLYLLISLIKKLVK